MRIRPLEGKAADANCAAASSIHAAACRHHHVSCSAAAALPRHHDGTGRRLRRAAQRAADVGVDGREVRDALRLVVTEPAKRDHSRWHLRGRRFPNWMRPSPCIDAATGLAGVHASRRVLFGLCDRLSGMTYWKCSPAIGHCAKGHEFDWQHCQHTLPHPMSSVCCCSLGGWPESSTLLLTYLLDTSPGRVKQCTCPK